MKRRVFLLVSFGGLLAIAYACGGSTTGDDGGATDSGTDSTLGDSGGGSDTGTADTGGSTCDGGCPTSSGPCGTNNACPGDSVCVTRSAGPGFTHDCYPLCGCNGTPCGCIGSCVCGGPGNNCSETDAGVLCSGGPISRREYKTDIDYVGELEREALTEQALSTRLAQYRYKTEPEGTQRHLGFIIDDVPAQSPAVERDGTHVDLYGYTSMLLATVQEQQKQIDELKKQVAALEARKHAP